MSVGARPLGPMQKTMVRIALLHDQQGKALVLLPADALLNLANVWKITGRQFQPVSAADATRFFAQEGLKTQRGQEQLLAMPLILDTHVKLKKLEAWEPFTGLILQITAERLKNAEFVGELGLTAELIYEQVEMQSDVDAITQALERFSAMRVRQRLEDTLSLPGFSQTTRKLIMLRCDPDAQVEELVEIVKVDAPVSAQVMSWAASPYYAAPGKVESLEDAVIRVLGFDLVINLALGVAMGQVMRMPDNTPRGATPFWLQSVATAVFAEKLARHSQLSCPPKRGLLYLAGLLHNLGYLLLAHLFPAQFSTLTRYIEANPHLPYALIEQQVLRVTREQVGAWLLESWSLPKEVFTAIRWQQDADNADEFADYARMLHISKKVMVELGFGDGPIETVTAEELALVGLSIEQKNQVVEAFLKDQDKLQALARLFGDK